MNDFFNWLAEAILGRYDGPMHFRLFLQPAMALFLAVRDGRSDAKIGKAPYFWSLFTEPEERKRRLHEGWKAVYKVFLLAFILDIAYQFLAMSEIHPFRAVIVAFVLAIIPYVLFRGAVTRLLSSGKKN